MTQIASSYRTEYMNPQVAHPARERSHKEMSIFHQLHKEILALHSSINNVKDLEEKSFVIGMGATQLINAAIYAYRKKLGSPDCKLAAVRPFYYLVPGMADRAKGYQFMATDSDDEKHQRIIEIVTFPRNPDGHLNLAASTETPFVIHDNVFYWPSFIPAWMKLLQQGADTTSAFPPLSLDISLFSLSKFCGLSGSRLGWAFVKDKEIADHMADYIYYSTHGLSVDSMYRALNILRFLNADRNVFQMFDVVSSTLLARWNWMRDLFRGSKKFQLAGEHGFTVCWIRCLDYPVIATSGGVDTPTRSCAWEFRKVGILARDGSEFGLTGHVRLNMMIHETTWKQVQPLLKELVTFDSLYSLIPSNSGANSAFSS